MLSTIALTGTGRICYGTEKDNGTGTIYQRANKTWVGKIYLGVDEAGKEKFKYFSGKTEAEVKKKIRECNQSGSRMRSDYRGMLQAVQNW